ncbi:MAG: hypothetical protein ABEN55_19270, partial [Bradymonadaceae bacterium]
MTALLGQGTHYLVVQSPDGLDGGPFNLTVDRVFTACAPSDNYCDKNGNAHVCTPDGGRFQDIECDAGCNAATGTCRPPKGDICLDAETIEPANAKTYEPDLQQVQDDYSIEKGGCLGRGETRTGGADMTYELKVPANKAVTAEVIFDNEVKGSMYMVEDCKDASGTCKLGAQGSTDDAFRETLTYSNQSDSAESYFLILDTKTGEQLAGAELQISYEDVICTPEAKRCDGSGSIEKCGQYGTEWNEFKKCGLGCNNSACRGDTCGDAIKVPNTKSDKGTKQSFSFPLGNFSSDHNIGASDRCTGSSYYAGDGKEAVFKLAADKGDIIDISWKPAEYGVLTVATDCSQLSNSCVAGESDYNDTVKTSFVADKQQTYYIVADTYNSGRGTSYSSSDLEVLVRQPDCTPGQYSATCSGSSTLQYCNHRGLFDKLKCGNSCKNRSCQPKTAQICADAISLGSGDSDTQDFAGI